jgi:hypothetical protein
MLPNTEKQHEGMCIYVFADVKINQNMNSKNIRVEKNKKS